MVFSSDSELNLLLIIIFVLISVSLFVSMLVFVISAFRANQRDYKNYYKPSDISDNGKSSDITDNGKSSDITDNGKSSVITENNKPPVITDNGKPSDITYNGRLTDIAYKPIDNTDFNKLTDIKEPEDPKNTWYKVEQNYCKKYCDKKYPVEGTVDYKNRDQDLVEILNHNKKIARRDYCFNTCQKNLYWNIIKIN